MACSVALLASPCRTHGRISVASRPQIPARRRRAVSADSQLWMKGDPIALCSSDSDSVWHCCIERSRTVHAADPFYLDPRRSPLNRANGITGEARRPVIDSRIASRSLNATVPLWPTGQRQQRRTWRDPKPDPLSQTASTASSESAATASTRAASVCA